MIENRYNQSINFASLNKRIMASAIDLFILFFFVSFFVEPIQYLIYGDRTIDVVLNELREELGNTDQISTTQLINKLSQESFFLKIICMNLSVLFIMAAYTVIFWIKYSTTPGKWITGCKVVGSDMVSNINTKTAIIRVLSYALSILPLMIGFIAIEFSKHSQGFHDKISKTYVVNFDKDFSRFSNIMKRLDGFFSKK